jgi:hypothetical protein
MDFHMQLFKIIAVFLLLALSPLASSTNVVEKVSQTSLKVFYNSFPTNTPGQYIEYNEKLLTVRQYNNQGLKKEFLVELSGHPGHQSDFKVFLDASANAIWVTDSHPNNGVNEYYLTVDKYGFDENGFTGDHQTINLPSSAFGNVQGFNNNRIYIVLADSTSGNVEYNFNEYDLTSEVSLERSLKLDEDIRSRPSPNGKFFITDKGIISLEGSALTWIDADFGFGPNQVPYFIDDHTILFKHMFGYSIGLINEKSISTSTILSDDSDRFQFDYEWRYLDPSSRTISFFDKNNIVTKSFSIDKINNTWQINDIELGIDINTFSDNFKRTIEGGLINRDYYFSYNEGKWHKQEQLEKGFELDWKYTFVSNLNDIPDDDLYSIFKGDVLSFKKLELNDNTEYQWHDIATIPKQIGEIGFVFKYKNKLYVFSENWDGTTFTSEAYSTEVVIFNMNGEQLTTMELPFIGLSAQFVANIYNGHIYITSQSGALKCTIELFSCENITPLTTFNDLPHYFNNFLYFYSSSENELIYYNTKDTNGWVKSEFEFPNSYSRTFIEFGDQLRFDDNLVIFNENGEVHSLKKIISANTENLYLHNYIENEFQNGKASCDVALAQCIFIDDEYILEFQSINSDSSIWYKNIKGTPYFYDRFEETHTLKIFKEREGLVIPEIKKASSGINQIMSKDAEVWQYETFKISLTDYFTNISYYEHQRPSGWPEFYNYFIADSNGNLEVTLTNEHTWQEPIIPFSIYSGYNDNFIMPVYPVNIITQDINEPPELKEGVSLTLTTIMKERIELNLNSLFRDPERKSLLYQVSNEPLPEWLALQYGSDLVGYISKPGTYDVKVRATDTSLDMLSTEFTLVFKIKDSNGTIPSANDKPSSSGGSFGWYLLMFSLVFMYRKRAA